MLGTLDRDEISDFSRHISATDTEWESKKDFFEWIMGNNTEVKELAEWIEV